MFVCVADSEKRRRRQASLEVWKYGKKRGKRREFEGLGDLLEGVGKTVDDDERTGKGGKGLDLGEIMSVPDQEEAANAVALSLLPASNKYCSIYR